MALPGKLLYVNSPDVVGIVLGRYTDAMDELNDEWFILTNGKVEIIRKWRIQEILS